ncbi:MAG TPA: hypothetical protein VF771_20545, partial [Longimicrobiaceae bacterium]
MKISLPLVLAALACAASPGAAQEVLGGRTLLPIASAPNGVVLVVDSGTIERTGDATFMATWVWRFPREMARRFGLDTELQRHEMDCAGTRDRVFRKWALKDDVPIAAQEGEAARPDTAWKAPSELDSSAFDAVCRFLLGGFAARLGVTPHQAHEETQPELLNRSDIGRLIMREYPEAFRRDHTPGTVLVRARITAEGTVDTTGMEVVRATDPA